ncbi:hypothetical protein [uncultured Gemmiger sp.]|uniref:hypothetical protein n=1 Tax=uncultured Gemmiger sp. TaxID=1623490 RepID=UPI0025FDA91C|nr:hypothetical protein [uncultured Gemmiger sp.]
MRITQKTLIDYNQIDTAIRIQSFVGDKDYARRLLNVKQDIARVYGRMSPNYSVLATVYDDKITTVEVVPHNYKL